MENKNNEIVNKKPEIVENRKKKIQFDTRLQLITHANSDLEHQISEAKIKIHENSLNKREAADKDMWVLWNNLNKIINKYNELILVARVAINKNQDYVANMEALVNKDD